MRMLHKEECMDGSERRFLFDDDAYFGNPQFDEKECYVSRSARITGRVILEKDVIVCPHTSLRADEGAPFKVCKGTNIQDSVIFHGLKDTFVRDEKTGEEFSILVGSHCAIAHRALVHGPAKIGKFSFIGFDVIVHGSIIGHNAFVDFRATIKSSTIGNHCHIGIGAIVNNVFIGNNRYVRDGQVVNDQKEADLLPIVPEAIANADNLFNKEVVEFNKELVKIYHQRRQHYMSERDRQR